jgi:hypothetical protein
MTSFLELVKTLATTPATGGRFFTGHAALLTVRSGDPLVPSERYWIVT